MQAHHHWWRVIILSSIWIVCCVMIFLVFFLDKWWSDHPSFSSSSCSTTNIQIILCVSLALLWRAQQLNVSPLIAHLYTTLWFLLMIWIPFNTSSSSIIIFRIKFVGSDLDFTSCLHWWRLKYTFFCLYKISSFKRCRTKMKKSKNKKHDEMHIFTFFLISLLFSSANM